MYLCVCVCVCVFIFVGIAYGQVYATVLATTYYASVMALTIRYLLASLEPILPWTYCHEEWQNVSCLPTTNPPSTHFNSTVNYISSAELFFT